MKTVMVAWLLVTIAVLRISVLPAAVAGVGLHVDTTAYVFQLLLLLLNV